MRNPLTDEEVIVCFLSQKAHDDFARVSGAGSRFILRRSGKNVHVLARIHRSAIEEARWHRCRLAKPTPVELRALERL